MKNGIGKSSASVKGDSSGSPDQIGIWRLGSEIHRSSEFRVFRSQPVDAAGSPRWDYVVKTASNEQARHGVCQSISVGASVQHPNLVPVLDGDACNEVAYLVMPLIPGQTMRATLDAVVSKPLPVALWLVRQLCQALDSLHHAGWTHRDVKPENIVVGQNGHVTLVDLAFCHHGTASADSPFRGTPRYAAPELFANASASSSASDIFAAGKILWEWLVKVDTENDLLLRPVCELVERMVDEVPQRRPSASEVTQTLLRLEIDTLGRHIGPVNVRRAA